MIEIIKNRKFKLGSSFEKFKEALLKGRFSIRKDISLIFLCGANQSVNIPSARRAFLKKSIEASLPHVRIVYAERVMEEMIKHGKTKNLLDIEHQISHVADWIIIVLESYSAFCELGAFAHHSFRKKLIVINDSNFKNEQSFINLGPIEAIKEHASPDRICWYPMASASPCDLDSIGVVLPSVIRNLKKKLDHPKVDVSSCKPDESSQISLFFLHDLIFICGPISHSETIAVYKEIFGEKESFDAVKSLRGILHASNLIESKDVGGVHYYTTTTKDTFLNFNTLSDSLLVSFRKFHLRHNPERILNV